MATLDEDTKQELTDAESVILMIESAGWKVVKDKLDAKIIDLQLIGNVEGTTSDEKVKNMEARGMAVSILFDWLKNDIYGYAEQQTLNSQNLRDKEDEGFITR
jgi:hypothetical protein